jgi:G3E family GTPase
MISLWLVAGFLGAGKTSLLKHLAAQQSSEQLVFLINEFAAQDVDGALLSLETNPPPLSAAPHEPLGRPPVVKTIPGGSIFCACLASEFIAELRHIACQHPQCSTVIVEASGMANPLVIEQLMAEAKLDQEFSLDCIVAVVDPGSFLKLRETLPNLVDQIKAADWVALNKTDLYPETVLCQTEFEIRQLNPAASLTRVCYGRMDFSKISQIPRHRNLTSTLAPGRDPRFVSHTLRPSEPIRLNNLRFGLARFGHAIYRLKGWVQTDQGWSYVDYSASGLSVTPMPSPDGEARLSVVLRPADEAAVWEFLRRLNGGTSNATSPA